MRIELDPHPEAPRSSAAPSTNPYASPQAALADTPNQDGPVVAVAKAQRYLLLSVLASLLGNAVMGQGGALGLAMLPVMLGIAAFSIWAVYKLCQALDRRPIMWVIAMFIPLVNFICLLVLNSQATAFLKDHGVEVGLLGVKV